MAPTSPSVPPPTHQAPVLPAAHVHAHSHDHSIQPHRQHHSHHHTHAHHHALGSTNDARRIDRHQGPSPNNHLAPMPAAAAAPGSTSAMESTSAPVAWPIFSLSSTLLLSSSSANSPAASPPIAPNLCIQTALSSARPPHSSPTAPLSKSPPPSIAHASLAADSNQSHAIPPLASPPFVAYAAISHPPEPRDVVMSDLIHPPSPSRPPPPPPPITTLPLTSSPPPTVSDPLPRPHSAPADLLLHTDDVAATADSPSTASAPSNHLVLGPDGFPLKPTDPYNPRTPAEEGAMQAYTHIAENHYQSSRLGLAEDAEDFPCSCYYRPGKDNIDKACGSDTSCINRLMFIECRAGACPVGRHCRNRRFQTRDYAPVEVFDAGPKGFGIRTLADLSANTFVLEYVGDVITRKRFLKRAKQYAQEGCKHFYFMALQGDQLIDAQKRGGLARFINHSCKPNCATQKWVVGGKLRIGLFTTRAVKRGQELTFDYQFERYGNEAQPCYCGEDNCSGFIGRGKDERAAEALEASLVAVAAGQVLDASEDDDDDDSSSSESDGGGDDDDDERMRGSGRKRGRRGKMARLSKKVKARRMLPSMLNALDESSLRRIIGPWMPDFHGGAPDLVRLKRDVDRLVGSGGRDEGAVLKALVRVPKVGAALLSMLRAALVVPECVEAEEEEEEEEVAVDVVDAAAAVVGDQPDKMDVERDVSSPGDAARGRPSGARIPSSSRSSSRSRSLSRSPPLDGNTSSRASSLAPSTNSLAPLGTSAVNPLPTLSADPDRVPIARKVLTLCDRMPISKRNTVSKPGLLSFVEHVAKEHTDDWIATTAKTLVAKWSALEEVWEIPKLANAGSMHSLPGAANGSGSTTPTGGAFATPPWSTVHAHSVPVPASAADRFRASTLSPQPYSSSPGAGHGPTPKPSGVGPLGPSRFHPSSMPPRPPPAPRVTPLSGWRAYPLAHAPIPGLVYFFHPVTSETRWELAPNMTATHVAELGIPAHQPPAPPPGMHPAIAQLQQQQQQQQGPGSGGGDAGLGVSVQQLQSVMDVVEAARREAERVEAEKAAAARLAHEREKEEERRRRAERLATSHSSGSGSRGKRDRERAKDRESSVGQWSDSPASTASALALGSPASGAGSKHSKSVLPEWYRAGIKQLVVQQLTKYRPRRSASKLSAEIAGGAPVLPTPTSAGSASPTTAAPATAMAAHPLEREEEFKQIARDLAHEVLAKQKAVKNDKDGVLPDDVVKKVKEYVKQKVEVMVHRHKKALKAAAAAAPGPASAEQHAA